MGFSPSEVTSSSDSLIEHIDGLYSYAVVLARNRNDAEDLVEETYIRALSAITRLNANSNLKSWMFTILRNVWLNRVRDDRAAPHVSGVDVDLYLPDIPVRIPNDPRSLLQSKEQQEQVREAVEQLSSEYREVVLLREFEDLSYQDIANILDCAIGTVMSRLARARADLRALLGVREGVHTASASGGRCE
jgi:RNA polymerase sigma-70 factor, ECF subfamily